MIADLNTVNLRLVEVDDVALHTVFASHRIPELHSGFARQHQEVLAKVLQLFFGQLLLEEVFGFTLLNQSAVLVEPEASERFLTLTPQQLLDRHLAIVVGSEVVEGYRSLEADEADRESEQLRSWALQKVSAFQHFVESIPATTAGVDLVGLLVTRVFEVITILVDEVPD